MGRRVMQRPFYYLYGKLPLWQGTKKAEGSSRNLLLCA